MTSPQSLKKRQSQDSEGITYFIAKFNFNSSILLEILFDLV